MWQDILRLPAGRELDVLVAEKFMGLNVVCRDWPCGYVPDCCQLEAAYFVIRDADGHYKEDSWYRETGPVYLPEYGVWPPKEYEPPCPDAEGLEVFAWVKPVPFYSTSIADANEVLSVLTRDAKHIELAFSRWDAGQEPCWRIWDVDRALQIHGGTIERSICLAALARVLRTEDEDG